MAGVTAYASVWGSGNGSIAVFQRERGLRAAADVGYTAAQMQRLDGQLRC